MYIYLYIVQKRITCVWSPPNTSEFQHYEDFLWPHNPPNSTLGNPTNSTNYNAHNDDHEKKQPVILP